MKAAEEFLAWKRAKGLVPFSIVSKRRELGVLQTFLQMKGVEDVREASRELMMSFPRFVKKYRGLGSTRGPSWQTVTRRLATARQYFAFLEDRGVIDGNPLGWWRMDRRPRRLPRNVPTEGEMALILSRADPGTPLGLRDRAILELMYSTGLRGGEVCGLDVGDVDLRDNQVLVRNGKGGKDRVVPLGRVAALYVGRYLREVRNKARPHPGPGARALFLSYKRGRMDQIGQRVKKYVGDFPFTSHGIRHACATHMIRNGAHVRMVQELLGHKDLATTSIYTRVVPLDLKAVYRRAHPHG